MAVQLYYRIQTFQILDNQWVPSGPAWDDRRLVTTVEIRPMHSLRVVRTGATGSGEVFCWLATQNWE
jgi:hypothetical protein